MKRLAIVSLLKPYDDIRHFEKFARSIAKTNKYEINIIGIGSKKRSPEQHILFNPFEKRVSGPLSYIQYLAYTIKKVIQVRPQVIVINHPGLLIFMIANRIIFGSKICYDVQENYYRNLVCQQNYPYLLRHFIGSMIRLVELISAPLISHFFLAEEVYVKQLKFVGKRYSIIENKALDSHTERRVQHGKITKIVFTGNISRNSGADIALHCFLKLYAQDQNLRLYMIGHCPSAKFLKHLKHLSCDNKNVTLDLGYTPRPYDQIQSAISDADLGIICYRENCSNEGKKPTKYFEYNAAGLPYLAPTGSQWQMLASSINISIDTENPDLMAIKQDLKHLPEANDTREFCWSTVDPEIQSVFNQILN